MSTYAFHYDYDAAGNRIAENKDGTTVYYHYDDANQLTEKETVGTGWTYYEYDANGSMVKEHDQAAGETTYFEYGDHGLVTKMTPPTGSPTQFHYDGRLQRYAIDWAGTVSYYQWDGMNQLVEKDASLSTVAQHTHGQTPIEGIGSVAVTKRSGEYQYPHYDHRGSLFELEDTGAEDLEAEYNAFGEELSRTGAAVTRFGYQGTAWMRLPIGADVPLLSPTRIDRPSLGMFLQADVLPQTALLVRSTGGNAMGRWIGRMWWDVVQQYLEIRGYGRAPTGDRLWVVGFPVLDLSYAYAANSVVSTLDPRGLRNVTMRFKYDFAGRPNCAEVMGVLDAIKKETDRVIQACVKECVCKDAKGNPEHQVKTEWTPVSGRPDSLGPYREGEPNVKGVDLYVVIGKVLGGAAGGYGAEYGGIFDPNEPSQQRRHKKFRSLEKSDRTSYAERAARYIVHEAVFHGMALKRSYGHHGEPWQYVDSQPPSAKKGAKLSPEACERLCKKLGIS